MAKYRVIVNREMCVACGAAPATCPEVYEIGSDNGKTKIADKYSIETNDRVSIGIVPEELYECAKSGAEVCPVAAIRIEEAEE